MLKVLSFMDFRKFPFLYLRKRNSVLAQSLGNNLKFTYSFIQRVPRLYSHQHKLLNRENIELAQKHFCAKTCRPKGALAPKCIGPKLQRQNTSTLSNGSKTSRRQNVCVNTSVRLPYSCLFRPTFLKNNLRSFDLKFQFIPRV